MAAGIHIVNNLFAFYVSGFCLDKITTNVNMLLFSMDIICVIIISILLLICLVNRIVLKIRMVKYSNFFLFFR